ncbi:RagB/SusD family nutrient uptake outer membrane protein [Bacteroides congonensis]|uniref:RagB/SusD family nutrient uptake outer membrane protein n=1 Tax=Bacteroides congonensis TaxID=1871006 RepID=UPI0026746D5E|nr:RagB/SusD family nutrient uptake outer membrane protein [Bacteroides congonensis]
MKKIKYTLLVLLIGAMQSCDYLDLSPVDSYGISNYWSTKDQAERFVRGLHYRVRERQEVLFKMGELRGGTFYNSNSSLFNQTISDVPAVTNNLSEANYVINNWGNFYMDIMQINHAIQSVPGSSALNETEKNYYMGVLHGLRSFYYFHLFRTYGGVPLIETARVMDGSFTPSDLNQPRATEEEVYDFLVKDIKASEDYFADDAFTINSTDKSSYWSKAATKMLRAEILLWGCKVKPIGGTSVYSKNISADLAAAKQALQDIIDCGKYGFASKTSFEDVFDVTKKDNKEMIFVIRYMLNEKENFFSKFMYPTNTNLVGFENADGVEYKGDNLNPLKLNGTASNYQYAKEFFDTFSENDIRRSATFFDVYKIDGGAAAILLNKYKGELDNDIRKFTNDWPVYRYADLQLLLAEIVALQGGDPAAYINSVRERAYGSAYAANKYPREGETAEDAILEERSKEFVGEGKRWYDIRRMKGGELAKALQTSVSGDLIEKHLLWPVDASVMSKDPLVQQTPGY